MAEAATAAPVEPQAPPQTEEPKQPSAEPEPKLAPKPPGENRFAFLARKEKAIVQERARLKAEGETLAKQRQEYESVRQRQASYAQNPLNVLDDLAQVLGVDRKQAYEMLTSGILSDGKPTPELVAAQSRAETEKLRAEIEKLRKDQVERDQKNNETAQARAIEAYKSEIQDYLGQHAEEFELITTLGQYEEVVYETAEALYQQAGKVPTIKEAAEKVEKFLEEQAEKVSKTKKLAARLAQKPKEEPKTLTNALTSAPSVLGGAPKSESDRIARALAALDRSGGKP